jgi:hypothetical protein
MGIEYNEPREKYESIKESQREEICMGKGDNSFIEGCFLHEEQAERKKEILELVQPWKTNSI